MILSFDTSGPFCAAALLDGGTLLAARAEPMKRGQAERLLPLLEEMLAEAGAGWKDVTRIGVGTGPGNFTGIRIAVATARGLALGLKIPAVGVTTFEVIRATSTADVAAVPATGGLFYLQHADATIIQSAEIPTGAATAHEDAAENAATVARVAAGKPTDTRPAPLYVRAADAAPSSEAAPVILDDA
ncbi:tRNA (adenosine(37)-N6)-threonylcarbamoyltransferase complex dimerization subunit type 1 TsaB [Sagittula stellata]|uniref:Gcp-like domain-containing protein n=1 Tax=Sagittula stellata (strain ATCC 700073 / DSM 11524 / E-37) TaxID=388399 RepID=A3K405_SAGS3|nr:tRNA (adenosine(37)-N6)-threonylcarbamoyltransferase complex dimerization subunit type 1 TsaB [Sagittula stellata]EBA08269.1 hypothetical protein SSE37_12014 [Sagittula stellata E-37]